MITSCPEHSFSSNLNLPKKEKHSNSDVNLNYIIKSTAFRHRVQLFLESKYKQDHS